jgi:ubiquinone/menaquinone biosynthesis C-methylase UbiE
MKYNIKYYSLEKAINRKNYFNNKPLFFEKGIDSNKIYFDYILNYINLFKNNNKKIKILDIGTGTGYVPQVLCSLSRDNFKIIGIDLAKEMMNVAKQNKDDRRIKYLIADNNELPFKSESFDIVTNKLSTRFSLKEVYRVLKRDGIFVFKEYGQSKGFKEIAEIFKDRYKKTNKNINDYISEISTLGFESTIVNLYQIKRTYSLDEIRDIFSMADLIYGFNEKDLIKIKHKLMKNNIIEVISDPFIILAKK